MRREKIPAKCQNCIYMRAWSIRMDGNHEYDCRKKPLSMVGKPDCECFEFCGSERKMINRETYCMDCDRSIHGKYHDCDVNIENDGRYVLADDKCYCKIVNGKRAELYPWEKGEKE